MSGLKVWILSSSKDHEGGHIDSVFAERELAADRFMDLAKGLNDRFGLGLDVPVSGGDGSLYIHSGCDWVSLDPHDLVSQLAIEPLRDRSASDADARLLDGEREN